MASHVAHIFGSMFLVAVLFSLMSVKLFGVGDSEFPMVKEKNKPLKDPCDILRYVMESG